MSESLAVWATRGSREAGLVRIGFNAHLLPRGATYRSAGVASYTRQMVVRLPRLAPEVEFEFFVPPGYSGFGNHASLFPTWNPLVRIVWEQSVQPIQAKRFHLDLLHGPVNIAPIISTVPTVITLHDLAFLKHPETFSTARRTYLRMIVPLVLRRARRIITPSEWTKKEAVNVFHLEPERIDVVPLGVDERYRRDPSLKSPIDGPYILYVGTLEPRKNIPLLVQAFALLRKAGLCHKLALVGPKGWMYDEIFELIRTENLEESIVIPGFAPDLAPWYNNASVFVYPSLYEGFGLPPLEAMACGTPVIVPESTSLTEVVGNAALQMPPNNAEALAQGIESILNDSELSAQLTDAGIARAAMFSWDGTAEGTLAVYKRAIG